MRNQNRINRILNLVKIYWNKYPDLRLGQLIVNISTNQDIFYIEDDVFETLLKQELQKLKEN